MRRNPDWKLSIEGHTDAVASDRYNLELSGRRAAAVKEALVGTFEIAGGRLTTAGYGESRPQDRNDTVEGRARNRRVELVRQ
jgi:outer membrane protein OmpA-like peptidoglycan-associated protein